MSRRLLRTWPLAIAMACAAGRPAVPAAPPPLGRSAPRGSSQHDPAVALASAEMRQARLDRACDLGNAEICRRLGRPHRQRRISTCRQASLDALVASAGNEPAAHRRMHAELDAACAQGVGFACERRGWDALVGTGQERPDLRRAAALHARACAFGCADACVRLGWQHARGQGLEPSPHRAVVMFRRSCDEGSLQGCTALAWSYVEGEGVLPDSVAAHTLLEEACLAGLGGACVGLGRLHERGWGVPRSSPTARRLWDRACRLGTAEACHLLRWLDGVPLPR